MTGLISIAGFPRMVRVRRAPAAAPELEAGAAVREALAGSAVLGVLRPGARVALAVGSRGIDAYATVVGAVVEAVRASGQSPFLLPAMGSHGGATPEGQLQILKDLGITAEALGLPVEAGMATLSLGSTEDGVVVPCAVAARAADAVVLINRVKPHTDFGGAIGSGLMKMAVVGLGKHDGAVAFHHAAQRLGYEPALRTMARVVLAQAPVLCGVGLVEDARHRLARVEVIRAACLEAEEGRLAAEASRLMARLPVEDVDVLVVERMGKNVSGTGMDPNVIGRQIHGYSLVESEMPRHPRIRRIVVLNLTSESHGNATGIGMADFTTARLIRAMDAQVTYTNALTALSLQGSKIPIHFATDREAIAAALATLGLPDPRAARVVRIRDTLSLETLELSEAYLAELSFHDDLVVDPQAREMAFDAEGRLS